MKNGQPNFIAFDVGSSKIAGVAAYVNKQGDAFVSAQVLKASEGFKSGFITNMTLAENTIISAIYSLEKDCTKSIKQAAISLSGAGVKSYYIKQNIKLGNQPISSQDIKKLINKALLDFKSKNQEVIHYIPLEFSINEGQIVEDPVGLYAKELSCNIHIISADTALIMNLTKCFSQCHVEISEIIVGIYASALGILTPDEMKLGAIVIDMGANTTSYGIFWDNKLIYVNHIPIGGASITLDIARTFSLGLKEAERIKILYGNAYPSSLMKDSVIRIADSDRTITSNELIKIIYPRIKNIFSQIQAQCEKMSMDHLLTRQMVITGGGAALDGIQSLAVELFQKQVRVAKPEPISGFTESYNAYSGSTILGIVKYKALILQKNAFKYSQHEVTGWFKKAFLWLKENI